VDATDPSGLCFVFGSTPCHDYVGQALGGFFGNVPVAYAPASEKDLRSRARRDPGNPNGNPIADAVLLVSSPEGKLVEFVFSRVGSKVVALVSDKLGSSAVSQGVRTGLKQIFGGCTCFPGQTLVQTPKGLQPIRSLTVGDQVLAEDPITDTTRPQTIQAVIDDGAKPLMAIVLQDGSVISVTKDHPFWVDAGSQLTQSGWLPADQVRVGDHLRTSRIGVDATVVRVHYNAGRAEVYTLTVQHDHTYFVGTAGVLVHNSNSAACPRGGVYVLIDPATGAVARSGRATNLVKRLGNHARAAATKNLIGQIVFETNIKAQQRGLEHLLHVQWSPPLNKIGALSPRRSYYSEYIQAAYDYLEQNLP